LVISACQKDTPIANYPAFPLQLTGKRGVEGVNLAWKTLKTTDFISYKIWRSNTIDSIPDNFLSKPDPNGFVQLITLISDAETLGFSDNSVIQFAFSGQTEFYYRLEMQLKGRSVLSRNIKVDLTSNIKVPYLGSFSNQFVVNNAVQKMYCFSKGSTDVAVFDAQTEKVTNVTLNTTTDVLPNNIAAIQSGNYEGKPELYMGNTTGSLRLFIVDATTMAVIQEIPLAVSSVTKITNIQTGKNGALYLTTNDASASLWIIDRNNPSIVNKYANPSGAKWRYFIHPITQRVIAVETGFPFQVMSVEPDNTTKKLKQGVAITLSNLNLTNSVSNLQNPNLLFLDNGNFVIDELGVALNESLTSASVVFDTKSNFGNLFNAQKFNTNDFVYIPNANTGNRILFWGDETNTIKTIPTLFFPQNIFVINNIPWVLSSATFTSNGFAFLEKLEF
jgi:hypothetical protein